jgi:hypothetical protein
MTKDYEKRIGLRLFLDYLENNDLDTDEIYNTII